MQKKYELVCYSTYSSDLLSFTNESHEGFVEFCVIEVFKLKENLMSSVRKRKQNHHIRYCNELILYLFSC